MTKPSHELAGDFDPFVVATVELRTTPAQLEMWLSEQEGEGAGGAYNESFSIRLQGDVRDDALERALRTLPEFHEALRGHFSEDGQRLVLESSVEVPIAKHDLSALSAAERDEQLAAIVHRDAATLYDLVKGPLFRAAIVVLDARTRVVLLSAHHMVCDGWSLDVLLADFARLYSAFVGASPLPDPPRHGFSDFVHRLEGEAMQAKRDGARTFWRQTLAEIPAALSLPEDGRRPLVRSFGANHDGLTISAALLDEMRAFARQNHVSLFGVLFAGYAALLHRLSDATDVVVGIPVAGHPEADMEDCVGHLVSFVPVRLRFAEDTSFLALCRQAGAALLDARENASVGFGEIVKELRLPRDPSRVPLVAATFTHVQRYAPGRLVFAGCTVDYALNPRAFETFELSLNAVEAKDGLHLLAHANADLFSPQWLSWRLRELETLLERVVAQPEVPLRTLPYLPQDELALLTAEVARAKAAYASEATLADLFERQVAATPTATAVIVGDVAVTYAELDADANRIARVLRERGAKRGTFVGLCLERGVPMIASLLAVQKAGAGYIPLDPSFPPDRLSYMLEDSQLALVVSQGALADVHGCAAERTVDVDKDAELIAAMPADPFRRDDNSAGAGDIAYVLYTSGSTGNPKGVCISHRAAVNFIESMRNEPGIAPSDKVLAVTTLSFDIALLELMGSLSTGATIVLATRDQAMDAHALLSLIDAHDVTILQATPVTWRLLLAADWRGSSKLKALVGGEALPKDLAAALVPKVAELWNMYGPTETTVWSTCGRIEKPEQGIDVGRPIANTSVWILDGHRNPCPIGVVGEIYIGGDGVALGYLRRAELTAERFVPDPFTDDGAARLYRTGDLGRRRGDGRIECLGRIDFQVKIRGFRIELGEIEAVLCKHPDIEQAVVVARSDRGYEAYLAAYATTRSGTMDPTVLRAHLKQSLPDYMVPQIFVALPSFPLTPNGKIDRKALPEPSSSGVSAAKEILAARNDLEATLAAIFAQVLGLPFVGVDQDFFALGGTSVSAIAACVRIEQQLKMKVPLRAFFEAPTVEGVARRRLHLGQVDDPIVVTLQAGQPGRVPLLCLMGVHLYVDVAKQITDGTPVVGMHVPIRYSPARGERPTLAAIAGRYLELVRRERPRGPYALLGLCYGGLVAYEVARLLREAGEDVVFVAMLDAILPRGAHRDSLDYLATCVVDSVQSPMRTVKRILGGAGSSALPVLSRLPLPQRLLSRIAASASRPSDENVDLPIDGDEVQSEVAVFESLRPYLDARLLVFRALGEPIPSWLRVHSDLGWCGFARSVQVFELESDHLSIVREPHARRLASELMKALPQG